jgi:hypothetical protein
MHIVKHARKAKKDVISMVSHIKLNAYDEFKRYIYDGSYDGVVAVVYVKEQGDGVIVVVYVKEQGIWTRFALIICYGQEDGKKLYFH